MKQAFRRYVTYGKSAMRKVIYVIWGRIPHKIKESIRNNFLAKKFALFITDNNKSYSRTLLSADGPTYFKIESSIDVVITTYKQSGFIEEAIQSILSQSFQVKSIFIINHFDDEEEQNSLDKILHRINDNRVSLANIDDCWPGQARNTGASLGNSELLLFLDADDFVSRDYLINAAFWLNFFSLDFVGAWCENFSDTNSERIYQNVWRTPLRPTWKNLVGSNAFPVSTLMRRSMFDSLGGWLDFNELGERQDEAINFWRRSAIHGYVGLNIQQKMIFLRRHTRNLSSQTNEQTFFNSENMSQSWRELLGVEGVEESNLVISKDSFRLNYSAFQFLSFPDSSSNPRAIFFLPDKTYFGAGKVIEWFYRNLLSRVDILCVNLDIQALGGDISSELQDKPLKILELGSVIEPEAWTDFIDAIIKEYNVEKFFSFGHPLINSILKNLGINNAGLGMYNCVFNTKSANAVWMQSNPNSFTKVYVESEVSKKFLTNSGWSHSRVVKIAHNSHRDKNDFSHFNVKPHDSSYAGVLWFGRMAAEKQPHKFIEYANRFKADERLRFTISGEGHLSNTIQTMVIRARNRNLTFQLKSRHALMSENLVYVSTSSEVEGRPLTVIEALEAGMIVLAPNSGSIQEISTDGYHGMFIYQSFDQFSYILESLDLELMATSRNDRSIHNIEVSNSRENLEIDL